ncbi:hypothetical protein NC652_017060 [Populus alba x Populus x berolinensis]|nr:hypothetical protein NC652_017060 [Populus alba x Populus x berolinensis]
MEVQQSGDNRNETKPWSRINKLRQKTVKKYGALSHIVDSINFSNACCLPKNGEGMYESEMIDNIPIPEKPSSDDLTEIQRWKWSVRKAKKIIQERHSQRCDTELKLSDGSCNGLQHYAALGRHSKEAAAVNLVAAEKPSDVYSEIAARVHEIIRRDSNKDPATNPHALLAKVIASEDQPVRWTTPLGLPVVQPYYKTQRHLIRTSLQVLALQREGSSV